MARSASAESEFHLNGKGQNKQAPSIHPILRPIPVMTDSTSSRFGFVDFAETWNGRLAMLGFVIGLFTEVLTGQGILGQIGLG